MIIRSSISTQQLATNIYRNCQNIITDMKISHVLVSVILFACMNVACSVPVRKAGPSKPYDTTFSGYSRDKINVHLIAHTHDDVGWLKTVDQYFVGSRADIQRAAVQTILDTVVDQLLKDSNRRFIYVEMAFFWRWWNQQSADRRTEVRTLVNEGRLEFINGGWCMNDEATAHFVDVTDQMTLGHQFLFQEFGVTPTVGWQIDPFGHSAVQAQLFALMGFDSQFFTRIDKDDLTERLNTNSLEMLWRGRHTELFTGVHQGYCPPGGLNFNGDRSDPIQDDPDIYDYNVKDVIDNLVSTAQAQALHVRTKHVMFTMGCDFQWENAVEWYKSLDRLIHYSKLDGRVNAFYSTPSMYTNAVNKDTKTFFPIKTDDFFPYHDRDNGFWTGYFTSRPDFKRFVRYSSAFLQLARQLDARTGRTRVDSLFLTEEPMAIAQHHDAITGTEKYHVAKDYTKRVSIGMDNAEELVSGMISEMLGDSGKDEFHWTHCRRFNESICEPSTSVEVTKDGFKVAVYNGLGKARDAFITIPVVGDQWEVTDANGLKLPAQSRSFSGVMRSPNAPGFGEHTLYFKASLAALGLATFTVKPIATPAPTAQPAQSEMELRASNGQDLVIANSFITLVFDSDTNLLKSMNGRQVQQKLMYYRGYDGDGQKSGAYIFRPQETEPTAVTDKPVLSYTNAEPGSIVTEVRQAWSDWGTQVFRLYEDKNYVEVEWTVGPIPVDDNDGKEVISRFITDIDNGGIFYTDAQGRDFQKRKINFRPTWNYTVTEPVSGNYYPINSALYMKDEIAVDGKESVQFGVLPDRACGGGAVSPGQLEIMLHRRLLVDDSRGVAEALNEIDETTNGVRNSGKYYLVLDKPEAAAVQMAMLAEEIYMFPLVLVKPAAGVAVDASVKALTSAFDASGVLPASVNLMTVQALSKHKLLIRVAHMLEQGADADVDLLALTEHLVNGSAEACKVTETALTGVQPLSSHTPLQWSTEKPVKKHAVVQERRALSLAKQNGVVSLKPMQIKTFVIDLKDKC